MKCGLIGKVLSQSYSKDIHQSISNLTYDLIELKEDEVENFILKKDFDFLNVTIPYKEKVIKFLDETSLDVKSIKAANLIINQDGVLKGYNTDTYGFISLLKYNHVCIKNKKVLILGSGASSKMVKYCLIRLGAKNIFVVSRNPKEGQISYEEASKKYDIDVIINTTPYGMYPNYQSNTLLSLNNFPYLQACVDLIYNPIRTEFLIEAKKRRIKSVNGLFMLVMQAIKAQEIYFKRKFEFDYCQNLYRNILLKESNIVLIGMPGCGKSTASKNLSRVLKKKRIDIDEEIEKRTNKKISEIFLESGEAYFRMLEHQIIEEVFQNKGNIISLGGGSLTNPLNIDSILRNSVIIFLNRDLKLLKENKNLSLTRPLLKQENALDNLYAQRIKLYYKYADIVINNNGSKQDTLEKILEQLL